MTHILVWGKADLSTGVQAVIMLILQSNKITGTCLKLQVSSP